MKFFAIGASVALLGQVVAAHFHHSSQKTVDEYESGRDKFLERMVAQRVVSQMREHAEKLFAEEKMLHNAATEVHSLVVEDKQKALDEARVERSFVDAERTVEREMREDKREFEEAERFLHTSSKGSVKHKRHARRAGRHHEATRAGAQTGKHGMIHGEKAMGRSSLREEVVAREAHVEKNIAVAERKVAELMRGHRKELAAEERLLHTAAHMAEKGAMAEKKAISSNAKLVKIEKRAGLIHAESTAAHLGTHKAKRGTATERLRIGKHAAKKARNSRLQVRHRHHHNHAAAAASAHSHERHDEKASVSSKRAILDLRKARAATQKQLGGTLVGAEVNELLREAQNAARDAARANQVREKLKHEVSFAVEDIAKQLRGSERQ